MDLLSINLDERLTMSLLGSAEVTVSCCPVQLTETQLIARVSERVPADACISIQHRDALLLGETCGCWQQDFSFYAAIKVHTVLNGLEGIGALMERQGFAGFGTEPSAQQEQSRRIV